MADQLAIALHCPSLLGGERSRTALDDALPVADGPPREPAREP